MSEDRVYRYQLVRSTGYPNHALVNFVGLNPSTADESSDDPTVRRLIGFARRHAFGLLILTNLYAFRVTDPRALKDAADPIGPENFRYLAAAARSSHCVVPCWGAHGAAQGRGREVLAMLQRLGDIRVFGLTKGGEPLHPLYLPGDTVMHQFGPPLNRPTAVSARNGPHSLRRYVVSARKPPDVLRRHFDAPLESP